MLDAAEIAQVHHLLWRETASIVAMLIQPAGSYRYLCDVNGIVMFTHHRIGRVLREY